MKSENPNQEEPEAPQAERQANEKAGKPPPEVSPTPIGLHRPITLSAHEASGHKQRDFFEKFRLGLELVGLVVLIAYTTFAGLQWSEMVKATNATRTAATAAQSSVGLAQQSLRTTIESFRLEQRPWVFVTPRSTR